MKLTIVIPTISRPTLARALRSVQKQEMLPGDEVILVGDGPQPVARALWEQFHLPGKYLEVKGPNADWGHTPRNLVQVHEGYIIALDDDDELSDGALKIIRQALEENPDRPHMFRMDGAPEIGTCWKVREVRQGNVGTPMFVLPAKGPKGKYAPVYGGDAVFMQETLAQWPEGSLVWREEIICHVRPYRDPPRRETMEWAYGVTTVPERWHDLLPKTLSSLAAAGFDSPRIFVDGTVGHLPSQRPLPVECKFSITERGDRIRTYGNWVLGLLELFLRNPSADRYAMFQDDLLAYRNLRQYLEQVSMRDRCYWNLMTFPVNHALCEGKKGFFLSNQRGKGAVGLVFSRDGVKTLLGHQLSIGHMLDRVENRKKDPTTGWEKGQESVDGGVVSALAKA